MDGWGVHTYRFVTEDGKTKLVKFRFRTLQGKASLVWEEAQVTAGKNADFHRQDLFDSIDKGFFPEWEVSHTFFFANYGLTVPLPRRQFWEPTKVLEGVVWRLYM